MRDWAGKRVTVTGGAGFLGTSVVQELRARGASEVAVPRSRDYDLREQEGVARMYRDTRPHMLVHLAAVAGGIGANRAEPGRFFYDNTIMGIQVIEQARRFDVEKLVVVGTVCSYPKFTPVPFREEDLWAGYPEETNAPYGLAKKMLLVQAQAYRQQYGLNAIYLMPANLYGPRDNFDPETSHVIPALIRKFVEAKEQGSRHVVLWGTGAPTREFLYVDDAAWGIVQAAERYEGAEPVNLGSGSEVSIRDLALLIRELVGYSGNLAMDPSKPDGQPRRVLDTTRAREGFGFQAQTDLRAGLRRTLEWYLETRPSPATKPRSPDRP